MNIFYIDESPIIAAQMQCDKHIPKMIVESAQMLSTAHRMLDGTEEKRLSKSGKRTVKYYKHHDDILEKYLYKAVHFNHPSTLWTRESAGNYVWHYMHFIALCDEYTYRYGKVHKSYELLSDVLGKIPKNIPDGPRTPIRLAITDKEYITECPIETYRAFYQSKQKRFKMVWTKREKPEWFNANV